MSFVRYTESVEQPKPDEEEVIDKIIASMTRTGETAARRYDHAVRVSHAKSTACLKGELRPLPDLPDELRQGLFASSDAHPVLIRLAQGPGELLKDDVSTHRGMAIKVLGVDGPKLAGHGTARTQDFVLASGPVFPNRDAADFLNNMRLLEAGSHAPEAVKEAVSKAALGIGSVFRSFGLDLPSLDFFGHPPVHPLAEPYFSQAAIRYGDYIAKLGVFPASPKVKDLARIDTRDNPDAFRDAVAAFFRTQDAAFDLCIQLCTDLDRMPVEDASVEWRQSDSPYRPVATLTVPAQAACSDARKAYFDDVLSFRPAHSLEAFRPLGSIMRARLRAYEALSAFRHTRNQVEAEEPQSIEAVPD